VTAIAAAAALASSRCSSVTDQLEAGSNDMSAAEIEALVNGALNLVDQALAAIPDFTAAESYDLANALTAMAARLETYAQAILEAKPPLIERVVAADAPLLVWAHETYGDSSRADELLRLNSIPDPLLVPAGTRLRCYAV